MAVHQHIVQFDQEQLQEDPARMELFSARLRAKKVDLARPGRPLERPGRRQRRGMLSLLKTMKYFQTLRMATLARTLQRHVLSTDRDGQLNTLVSKIKEMEDRLISLSRESQ